MRKLMVLLSIMVLMTTGCFARDSFISGEHYWTDDEVNRYYESQNSIWALNDDLIAKGTHWDSDGLNSTPWTDTFASPNSVMTYKAGNCGDFMNLFQKYIEHMCSVGIKIADTTHQIYMRKGLAWHYVLLIQIGNNYYMQSNLSITPVTGYEEVKEIWFQKGYEYFDIINTWQYPKQ